jgi:hypothetical protein
MGIQLLSDHGSSATREQPKKVQGMKVQLRKAIPAILVLFTLNTAAVTRYVDLNCTNATLPYTNWLTAARNIQDAIDSAAAADVILVTNGVYKTGGRVIYGSLNNRIAINRPVTVQSVNGPAVTVIQGNPVVGVDAVRCAYLGDHTTLSGFTLTNGATGTFPWPSPIPGNTWGGGVWCEYASAVVSNCVITSNHAAYQGGGAFGGTLIDCLIIGNSADYGHGGGACSNTLVKCTLVNNTCSRGGGADSCILYSSTILSNSGSYGGGTFGCTVKNCALIDNQASSGGGAYESILDNCTLTGNRASNGGGGSYASSLNNSIVYYNSVVARTPALSTTRSFIIIQWSMVLPPTVPTTLEAVSTIVALRRCLPLVWGTSLRSPDWLTLRTSTRTLPVAEPAAPHTAAGLILTATPG